MSVGRLFLVITALALSACGAAPAAPPAAQTLRLVASTPLVRDLVANLVVGIPNASVVSIVAPGSDPHEYEPTPTDARTVAGAGAIIVVGAQYEDAWLTRLIQNAGGQRPIIVAAEGIPLNAIDQAFASEFDRDPHVWMDPARWQQAARNVAKGLAALDPSIATAVNANADAYVAKLKDLDAYVKAETGKIPEAQRVLVTTHDAMGYYAERYGFKVVGAVIASSSSAAAEPSAQSVKRLVDLIKANKVKAVFSEAGLNPKLTEAVAKEAGVAFVGALYIDTLSDATGPAATYIDMIRYNTVTIVGAPR
ncbi:MAG TPA: metal ABC transporter substrate-binding protein [Thermoflexales bacterium]|nr:metal ABC transporter substrate-binding protein [Thermoflexales bacterium]HQY23881.1 metal ABC transporter substrate-binding protein [Thermoflexales bacterium]HQZ53609.1 metal ABC transporter substrate-binding protein [Thermoflexales bacterium]HRA53666.1 metal ABC transporter substrate-binding protein [Thermoflexales bacterium]